MKPLRIIVPIVLTGLVCALAGYRVGQQRQRRVTFAMIDGDFLSDFTALKQFRAGDTDGAIHRIETHAFMDATVLLYDPHAEHKALDMLIPNLSIIAMPIALIQAIGRQWNGTSNGFSPLENEVA